MRRTVVTWAAVMALLVAGFGASVVALNADIYSAHGFVGRYLEALERQDAAAALALPGVRTGNDAAAELLTSDAMGTLSDVRTISDVAAGDGRHTVVAEYTIAAPDGSGATTERSEFVVASDGTRFGLFPSWRFVSSPINSISITVLHDQNFTVNGFDVTTKAAPDAAAAFQVFAPGFYELQHDSTYLTAKKVTAAITEIGGIADATVDVQANEAFVAEVQKHVSAYLGECATQTVMLPTGCPFGQSLAKIVTGVPEWSMVSDPVVTIVPGTPSGTWAVPKVPAVAHLVVETKSYFDGRVTTFDEDVPFDVQYALTFEPGNKLLITAVYE